MRNKPLLVAINGTAAQELVMRDALSGLEDFASYIGLNTCPWPFEILPLSSGIQEKPLSASPINPPQKSHLKVLATPARRRCG